MALATNSSPAPANYFTCTLGEAARMTSGHRDLQTINDLIDLQAKTCSQDIAVGFPVPGRDCHDWTYECFTFEDLKIGSSAVGKVLACVLSRQAKSSGTKCVALLCPSSVDFLFAWLGLMRNGLSVLLVAPQCRPAAIAHLCKSCEVSILFHDKSTLELASSAVSKAKSSLVAVEFPWQALEIPVTCLVRSSKPTQELQSRGHGNALDPAFIFHTSGTSTGLPKPITQSHQAAFRVLPSFDERESATFTTTPLYHGGIADCLRAWTSVAAVWLFPAADVPVTTQNIRCCLSAAASARLKTSAAQVKYFSSVPYILEMLAKDNSGLDILQSMKIVGVGGAALSPKVGNYLVDKGVNLVSRFGSAECGFLLSSHRNYNSDKAWDYLRLMSEIDCLCFEECDDGSGLSELVVKKGWPHIAQGNREDGSFATSDLFEPHGTIEKAWRYQGRSDSQIVLITGKKFDPVPLEDLISLSSSLIREVIVFGTGRQNPGVLIFPSKDSISMKDSDLEKVIWEIVQDINSNGQGHTRIHRDKVIILSAEQPALERSSKGTLMRGAAEKRFAETIDSVYSQDAITPEQHVEPIIDDDDVKYHVQKIVLNAFGVDQSLGDDADFYAHGVDSTMCIQIRSLLQKYFGNSESALPWNVVYDCGNINRLSQFLVEFRNGNAKSERNEQTEMLDLVRKFSKLNIGAQYRNEKHRKVEAPYVVLLTGATGALGAHVLDNLRKSSSTSQVICLVRAVDHLAARSRVSASLVKRRKPSLDMSDSKVWCLPCKLHDADLGLSDVELSGIRQNTTHIIHAAWAVNFSLPLKSFVSEHIAGIQNLLNLTLSCSIAIQFNFCSSTASVLEWKEAPRIEERISTAPSDASSTGYSKSKWVAEAICAAASEVLPGTVNVLRIGQLTGDTENGVWNISEAWPLMLSTVDVLSCLPEVEEPLSWLPLNNAGSAVVEITFHNIEVEGQLLVYHLVNNLTEPKWSDLLAWITETRSTSFDIVSPTTWLDKLEKYPKKHPAKNLVGLWMDAYGKHNEEDHSTTLRRDKVFSIEKAEKKSNVMRNLRPVDQGLVNKIWAWLEDEVRAGNVDVSGDSPPGHS